ncbi:MAG: T9SS type A sorting domain-containing protein [Bacteroidota bacterium]|nr:T9SS type A sorting domain-containing protein [Bacteroidota bacterium]
MKKLFIFILALVFVIPSYATHLMGGQITTTYLGTDSTGAHYAIEFTAYRDTIGVQMAGTAMFNIHQLDTSGNWNGILTSTVMYDTTSGGLMPTVTVYGVEVYTYLDTITLPGDGYYSISWSGCCRNGAIVNMANPLGENMALTTYFTVDSLNPNSSATYLTPPVSYLPSDTTWQYNPLPFDPDGDSLAWSLAVPLNGNGTVNGYQFLSDTALYSNVSGIFSLDSITGALSWNAKMAGNFVASFIIDEYRNGVKIGEMRRDMQFIVINDTTNAMPQISNMQSVPTNSAGYPYVYLTPGQNYQLHLLGNDADVNDVLSMDAFGSPFTMLISPATFGYTQTGNGNEIEGTFDWTPDVSHISTTPYSIVFRTSDNTFYFDNTVQFEVASATSVEEEDDARINTIYPNPLTEGNSLYIPINLKESQKVILDVYTLLGTKVFEGRELELNSGYHVVEQNIDLHNGQYFVTLKDENNIIISTQKILIVK